MYLDANNLYGLAVSQYLRTGGFKWMCDEKINNLNLSRYTKDSKKGLTLSLLLLSGLDIR